MSRKTFGGRSALGRRVLAPAALAALAVAMPSAGFAVGDIHEGTARAEVRDFDARQGSVRPTARQLGLVRNLRAQVVWNRFGTPQSLLRRAGYLERGIAARTPEVAARKWLAANRSLFRLRSTNGLEIALANPLGRRGYAVTFRQRIGGLVAAEGGLLNVALRREAGKWNVVYAGGTITGDTTLLRPVPHRTAVKRCRARPASSESSCAFATCPRSAPAAAGA